MLGPACLQDYALIHHHLCGTFLWFGIQLSCIIHLLRVRGLGKFPTALVLLTHWLYRLFGYTSTKNAPWFTFRCGAALCCLSTGSKRVVDSVSFRMSNGCKSNGPDLAPTITRHLGGCLKMNIYNIVRTQIDLFREGFLEANPFCLRVDGWLLLPIAHSGKKTMQRILKSTPQMVMMQRLFARNSTRQSAIWKGENWPFGQL